MTDMIQPFTPDWISPPGDTIADLLEERDWTQANLAKRLGYSRKHVSQLINGEATLGEDAALKLEKVLGGSASFWLQREAQYRARIAEISESDRLQTWLPWLAELPVKPLMKQGVIPERRMVAHNKLTVLKDMLHFFGVASPEEWRILYANVECAFRRSQTSSSNRGAIATWMRRGEIEAEQHSCPKYKIAAFKKALHEIRMLTVASQEHYLPTMQVLCREAGVVFVTIPTIPGARVSGMARWLSPHRALIQLSLYGKQNDRFWFTFFHEAAHVLLHGKDTPFIDDLESKAVPQSEQELEADRWAQTYLIPERYERELPFLKSKQSVIRFAEQIGIHPGIIVGRLQHEKYIHFSAMNDLKDCL